MEEAEIVEKTEGWWVILAKGGLRYFVTDRQIAGGRRPFIGQKGRIGYVQGPVSMMQTFIAEDN